MVGPARDGLVETSVVDEGRGIPADVAPSVLEWGARGPRSRGQGIGRHEACRLVTEMGGRLTMDSVDGVGTRVSVSRPAVVSEMTRHAVRT